MVTPILRGRKTKKSSRKRLKRKKIQRVRCPARQVDKVKCSLQLILRKMKMGELTMGFRNVVD